jgi:hypothetical protein
MISTMSSTNTMKMDAEASWFFMRYEKDNTGKGSSITVDPWEVLGKRFPDAERRMLRELCEELRATGPWVPRDISSSDWHGAYL